LLGKPERRAHIDRHAATGLAISGFDPVAYFTDSKAVPGRPELELNLKGVVWRFRSEGNRAAFQLAPDAYAPRFGGYDPVAISRETVRSRDTRCSGRSRASGFTCSTGAENREAFLAEPSRILASAARNWSHVARMVAR
jgi:hypothetical protein